MNERLHPRKNTELAGHAAAENEIIDAWTSGRLHHAWLISGPKGIGKATLAYRFGRFVLAGGGSPPIDAAALFSAEEIPAEHASLEIDAEHPVFKRVAANGHGDLQVIERGLSDDGKRMQSVIPVEKIRAVGHTMSLTSGEGGWRVVIIDGAEEMNANAANALLKVLEEPPPRALILLVTHTPGRLLPTIRSRCSHLRLSSLALNTVDNLILQHRPDLNAEDRRILCRLSDGSIGRALDLADSGGVALQRDLIAIMNSFPSMDVKFAHKFADKFARRDTDAAWRTAVELASRSLADIVSASARGEDLGARGYDPTEAASLSRLQTLASPDAWIDVWEKNAGLFAKADSANLDRKQVMLNALANMENITRTGV